MIDILFKDLVYGVRIISSAQNSLGEPNYSNSTFIGSASSTGPFSPYAAARIEGYRARTQYRDSNLRKVNETIIYVKTGIFAEGDRMYKSDGTYLGIVIGINEAVLTSVGFDHFELIVENP